MLLSYNPNIYNNLNDIEQVEKLVSNQQILPLGKIILKYGYGEEVTVIKAHKHFKLQAWEAMLERENDGIGYITSPATLEEIAKIGAVSNIIALGQGDDEMRWYPVNYALDANNSFLSNDAFLREAAKYLVDNNLADVLMIGSAHAYQGMLMERNFDDCRTSELMPMEGPGETNAIATTFKFHWTPTPDGDGAEMVTMQNCSFCKRDLSFQTRNFIFNKRKERA